MAKLISAGTASQTDVATAGQNVDRCLNSMLHQSRPVCIGVPVDVSRCLISDAGLTTPLKMTLQPNDKVTEDAVDALILSRLTKSCYPIIVVDGNAVRNECIKEVDKLAELPEVPYFTTCMGNGGPNEDLSNFAGVYQGTGSLEPIGAAVEDRADCVLYLGSFRTNFNTGEFTDDVKEPVMINLQRVFSTVGVKRYGDGIEGVLESLIKRLEQEPLNMSSAVTWDRYPREEGDPRRSCRRDSLWSALAKLFRSGDVVIGETGASAFDL